MARAVLTPEERANREKMSADAWAPFRERGTELRREAQRTEAAQRKEDGLPPEGPKQGEAVRQ